MGCFERMGYLEEGGEVPKNKMLIQQKMSKTQTFDRPWRYFSLSQFTLTL